MKKIKIISWMILIVLSITFFYTVANHSGNYFANIDEDVVAGFYLLPALFIAGLYGYYVSSIVFTIAFGIALYFKMEDAYAMIIHMAAMACFSLCGQNFWFKSKLRTFLTCTITLIVITVNEFLCFVVLDELSYGNLTIADINLYTYKEIIAIYGTGLFLYIYCNHIPDKYKILFPITYEYTETYQNDHELRSKHRKTKISIKITTVIIVIEIIMGICVGLFMMVLFPDIKHFLVQRHERDMELPSAVVEMDTDFEKQLEQIDFMIDGPMIAFDLKMVLLLLCMGVPMAAISNFFTKMYICTPIGLMSSFMEKYASASDDDKILYGHKVDDIQVNTNDEIQVMYNALNEMVYEMEAFIQRQEEKAQIEADLEIAKKSNEAKSNFLSNMSHEIRTPINAILGMNEMILRESNDAQVTEYAVNVKSAGNSLLSLVNDILDFSKIEAGKMEILPVQYNLGSLLNDLVNMVSAKAQEKGLDLEIEVDSNMPANLIGDEIRLKQVVTNILTNSVKYTEKGRVLLSVFYEEYNDNNIILHFEVSDTGIGIKEEDLQRLYSPFERIEEIRNRTIEGTGLGMSIVKKILAMMDTKLEVESKYGLGSIFSFGVKQQVVSWEPIGDFKEKYREYIDSVEQYHESFHAPEAQILVVDDTQMNLTVIKSFLKQTQIQITTAESGKETLDLVAKKHFDVIFLDHRMPEMDGIETFEAMKAMPDNLNRDVPVIALTANAIFGAREEYMKHGFTDYISKPVNGIQLEQMLLHYLPVEKISSVSIRNGEDNYKSEFSKIVPEDSKLNNLSGVDIKAGITNCGDVETYESVVTDFYNSIDRNADAIEGFLNEKDIRNFTVLVHALKSSARLIGALELSDMAAHLEDMGNQENCEEISKLTPALLEKYRMYKVHLAVMADEEDDSLPEIPAEQLEGAFKDMKELIEAYDFDTADSIMLMLKDYSIPLDLKNKYNKVKELMTAVDRDGLLEIL